MFNEIKKKVNSIPIKEIAAWVFDEPNPKRWLCPFHDDRHPGSFKIFGRENKFKCFACGEFGNGVDLVEKVFNCSWKEAIVRIAAHFEICSDEELENLKKEFNYSGKNEERVKVQKWEKSKTEEPDLQDEEILDFVYRLFSKGMNLVSPENKVLSDEHHKYLNGRGISDEEIERNGYFSMPTREILPVLCQKLELHGIEESDLIGVPGFYRYKDSGKIDMIQVPGIGIAIKNERHKIVGIQIRKDTLNYPGDARYIWFSSAFIYNNPAAMKILEGGTSPHSPIDVVFPSKITAKYAVITEGHFKAAKFAEHYHCITVSVQGVGNFNGIENVLKSLKIDTVYIAYDADMCFNLQVSKHAANLSKLLTANSIRVNFLLWKYEYGKGIDDVLDAHNEKEFFGMSVVRYQKFMHSYLHDVQQKYGKIDNRTFSKIDRSELNKIYSSEIEKLKKASA